VKALQKAKTPHVRAGLSKQAIVGWACKRGRAAIFADTGLGKTAMQTAWAALMPENETRKRA